MIKRSKTATIYEFCARMTAQRVPFSSHTESFSNPYNYTNELSDVFIQF